MYWIACFLSVCFIVGLFLHWIFNQLNVFVGVASQSNWRGILIMSLYSMSMMLILLMCIDWISPLRQLSDYRIWIQWSFLLAILFLILNKIEFHFKGWDFVFNLLVAHIMSLSLLAVIKLILMIFSL